ncbi:MarR family transcriptional regulator [Altererythrobacter sp. ZODW24]|uniref:MarR family winged helix-turn-helix transcriptional regulator n=1 Tax=Altererythrobacter sp. ZODW24 TaxID=2185142 RepID=UPI0013B3A533|nr:MarR family transcriptional regulator [Altererythrobacter sp. ZODW24]
MKAGADNIPRKTRLRLGSLIHDVSRLRRTVADRAMREYEITWAQGWMLLHLDNHEGEMRQVDLAVILDIGTVALGTQIDRLEERGLVERRADPGDRRSKHLFLTQAGEQKLAEILPAALELDGMMTEGFSAEELAETAAVLQRMKDRLVELDDGQRGS